MAHALAQGGFAPVRTASASKGDGYFAKLVADFKAWLQAREVLAQLDSMSPRMLDDIGLTRYDVDVALRHGELPIR